MRLAWSISRGRQSEDSLEILDRIDVRTGAFQGVRHPDLEAIFERAQLLESLGGFQPGGCEGGDS
jgi:hypothetical protein